MVEKFRLIVSEALDLYLATNVRTIIHTEPNQFLYYKFYIDEGKRFSEKLGLYYMCYASEVKCRGQWVEVTCDQAIFFFFGGGKEIVFFFPAPHPHPPPPEKKSLDHRASGVWVWVVGVGQGRG